MQIIDAMKPWMARFDRMSLRERAGLVVAMAAVLYFLLSLLLLGPQATTRKVLTQRIQAQQVELETLRKGIREFSGALERDDPNSMKQQAQLDEIKRGIAEADAMLAQLDGGASGGAGEVLREVLATTPGLQLVSLKTLPVTVVFQSKPAPVTSAKPAPGPKDAAPKPESISRPPRSIYRHGIEISIKGNFLALLPYLEKLQNYPGHLYWTDASLDVESYPVAVLRLNVYTLSGQPNPRLG